MTLPGHLAHPLKHALKSAGALPDRLNQADALSAGERMTKAPKRQTHAETPLYLAIVESAPNSFSFCLALSLPGDFSSDLL